MFLGALGHGLSHQWVQPTLELINIPVEIKYLIFLYNFSKTKINHVPYHL